MASIGQSEHLVELRDDLLLGVVLREHRLCLGNNPSADIALGAAETTSRATTYGTGRKCATKDGEDDEKEEDSAHR